MSIASIVVVVIVSVLVVKIVFDVFRLVAAKRRLQEVQDQVRNTRARRRSNLDDYLVIAREDLRGSKDRENVLSALQVLVQYGTEDDLQLLESASLRWRSDPMIQRFVGMTLSSINSRRNSISQNEKTVA